MKDQKTQAEPIDCPQMEHFSQCLVFGKHEDTPIFEHSDAIIQTTLFGKVQAWAQKKENLVLMGQKPK